MRVSIVTFNVNGLQSIAAKYVALRHLLEDSNFEGAQILCFQEVKIYAGQIPAQVPLVDGWNGFFSCSSVRGFSGQSNAGYSGVATYVRGDSGLGPVAAVEGFLARLDDRDNADFVGLADEHGISISDIEAFQKEGRIVITDHRAFVLVNGYFPSTSPDAERWRFKLGFNKAVELRVATLRKVGRRVIVAGDLNIIHKKIDAADTKDRRNFEDKHEPRVWLNDFFGQGYVDLFRRFHPDLENQFTHWNYLTNARETNCGTRLDYIVADAELARRALDCKILAHMKGSDHCPVLAHLEFDPSDLVVEAHKVPALCSANLYRGTQKSIRQFFANRSESEELMPSEAGAEAGSAKRRKRLGPRQKSIKNFFAPRPPERAQSVSASDGGKTGPVVITGTSIHNDNDDDNDDIRSQQPQQDRQANAVRSWARLLSGPPRCPGHNEPCVVREVKEGENVGRHFFVCNRPKGTIGDPRGRCDFFKWVSRTKRKAVGS